MALAQQNTMKAPLKRFPLDVREELNKIVHRGSWQALTKEFSVDVYTGLKGEALDFFPNLVDSRYGECREHVRERMEILKMMKIGETKSLKGEHSIGFHSYFYRFWLVGQRRPDGLYDIVFAHIARREEFDLFLSLKKIMKGSAYAITTTPPIISDIVARLSHRAYKCLLDGLFGGDVQPLIPVPTSPPTAEPPASPYTDLTEKLGDRLTDFEMVEDLIERGMLAENEDGTLYIQLK